jgi:hypothetical protein
MQLGLRLWTLATFVWAAGCSLYLWGHCTRLFSNGVVWCGGVPGFPVAADPLLADILAYYLGLPFLLLALGWLTVWALGAAEAH